jgi:hypothetical protein
MMITINRENGCAVQYSESPLALPNGEVVFFKIEGILKPEKVGDEVMEDFLREVGNKLNTEVLKRKEMQGVFPQFYISCPFVNNADVFVRLFKMSYVEALGIMLCPPCDQLRFQGSWEEYKQYKTMRGELVLVANAEDTEDDGSMIQHWVDNTHYAFHKEPYLCPATHDLLGRDGLDGAHVEIVGYPEMGRFITPVRKDFNRGHSRGSFYVKPEYLVVAP